MKPGDIFVARDEMRHAIVAMKGPYMHVVVQIPSTFQYGFLFKETVFPASDFVQSDGIKIPLEEVLRRNKPGIYKLDDIDGDILETLRARVTGAERNISHSL
jgi:hypothetical protein